MLPPKPQILMDICAQKPCPHNSHCLQTGPSFQCLCLQGWTGPLCNFPLSSCQKAALSQGTNPRTNWGTDEERKGIPLYLIPKGILTQHLAKTTNSQSNTDQPLLLILQFIPPITMLNATQTTLTNPVNKMPGYHKHWDIT